MLLGTFFTLILYLQWIKCETLSTQNVINLQSLNKIEISNYNGKINKEVFSFFQHITELELKNNNITFTTNFLQALPKLRKLTMIQNRITTESSNSNLTECCEFIKEFRLVNNHMNDLKIEEIAKIKHLFVLVLTGESVLILRKNVFTESPRITQMNITYSGLRVIEIGAFNGLSELTVLNLEGNKLRSVSNEILKPLQVLKMLMLGKNMLEVFSGDTVHNLDWLEYVDISRNPVKELHIENIREMTIRLKEMDVTGINGTTQGIIKFRP